MSKISIGNLVLTPEAIRVAMNAGLLSNNSKIVAERILSYLDNPMEVTCMIDQPRLEHLRGFEPVSDAMYQFTYEIPVTIYGVDSKALSFFINWYRNSYKAFFTHLAKTKLEALLVDVDDKLASWDCVGNDKIILKICVKKIS